MARGLSRGQFLRQNCTLDDAPVHRQFLLCASATDEGSRLYITEVYDWKNRRRRVE